MSSLWNHILILLGIRQAPHPLSPGPLVRNLSVVIGVVLIWRGIWLLLDELDKLLFGASHIWTAIFGIILGLLVLYLPDRNRDEIERL